MTKLAQGVRDILDFLLELLYSVIRNNDSRIAAKLRRRLLGKSCFIDTNVRIARKENFVTGDNCAIYHGTYILNRNGVFRMGMNSHLGAFCHVNVALGSVEIGNDVAVGPSCCLIAYSNHYAAGKKVTEVKLEADIHIGNNVFIGAGCYLLPGTSIGNNVIIGAGSVVKGEVEENGIYAGAPCRLISRGWFTESEDLHDGANAQLS